MAGVTIPTTAQQAAVNKANIEARLNVTTPAADKAFNTVLATVEALQFTSLYKFGADRFLAGLVISAQAADLDYLGQEYGLPRITAVVAILTATLAATDGTIIPIGTIFTSSANQLQYTVQAQVTAPYPGGTGTGATITLACTTPGASSNLSNASSLSIQNPIAGAGSTAAVASTTTTGADAELDPAYRARLLSLTQTIPNGSNSAAYRQWGQAVAGIVNVYPYAGSPYGSGITSYPGMRTIYVECATSIQADGLCPGTWTPSTGTGTGLLAQVANALITDPNTGIGRQDLGLVVSTLYVQPISRTPLYVTITSLNVPSSLTAACQADIQSAIQTYLLTVAPYVAGCDPSFNRSDTYTQNQLAMTVQQVLILYGASVTNVAFGVVAGTYLTSYQAGAGEKLKLSVPITWN